MRLGSAFVIAPPVDGDLRAGYLDGPASLRAAAPGNIAENHRMPIIHQFGLSTLIVVAVGLSGWIGYPGLALANSLAFSTEAVLFLVILYRRRIL